MTVDLAEKGARRRGVRFVVLGCGLLVLLGLAYADFRAKHGTLVGPTTRLQADGPRGTRPLADERRTDGLPDRIFWDDDAYYWLSYARASIEERTLSPRHTSVDNAPYGREIHWCSGPTWILVALAAPLHLTGDRSLEQSLSLAALFVHPLLFASLLIGTTLLIAVRVGPISALALSACLLLTPVLSRDLSYGTLDHHALLLLFAAGMLLCLQLAGAGYVPADGSRARPDALIAAHRWTLASAICTGAGLWVQAIFQSLLIAGVLLGAMLGGLLFARGRSRSGDARRPVAPTLLSVPELWRTWGRVGAATSLALYVVEQFPALPGMRLEVNHPLYALALLAGGETVYRVLRLLDRPSRERLAADLPLLALCSAAILAPVLAVLLGPADWFWLRDPFLQRVHESIVGYQPASALFFRSGPALRVLIGEFGALPLFPLYAAAVLILCKGAGARGARILVALGPVLVALALYLRFVRNGGLLVTVLIALGLAVLNPADREPGRARRIAAPILAFLLLACAGFAWYLGWHAHHPFVGTDRFAPGAVRKLDYRDLARELRGRVPPGERLVMTGSDLAPSLHYFGEFAVTSGLYWENRDGLRATAEFFAAHDDERARAIVESRGIPYVLFWAGPPAVVRWHRLLYGHAEPASVERTLAHRLANGTQVPGWLQEITDEFPRTALPFNVKVFRVVGVGAQPGP